MDRHTNEKPDLLLVCRHAPSPLGSPARIRAWQLLRDAQRTHNVHLVCQSDRPISLDQWRAIEANTKKSRIEPRIRTLIASRESNLTRAARELAHDIASERKTDLDAIVFADAGLAHAIADIPRRFTAIDLFTPHSESDLISAISHANLLLVPHRAQENRLRNFARVTANTKQHQIRVLPQSLDTQTLLTRALKTLPLSVATLALASANARQTHTPHLNTRVIIYTDTNDGQTSRIAARLIRRLANVNLQATHTHTDNINAIQFLKAADLVLCPRATHAQSQFALTHAMLMRKPIITDIPAPTAPTAPHFATASSESEIVSRTVALAKPDSHPLREKLAATAFRFAIDTAIAYDRDAILSNALRPVPLATHTRIAGAPTTPLTPPTRPTQRAA